MSSCARAVDKKEPPLTQLTVRNVTSVPLEVVLIERYTASHVSSSSQLAANASKLRSYSVTLRIAPFSLIRADVDGPDVASKECLRLTLVAELQKYRASIPDFQHRSQNLKALSPDPLYSFTAVYLPEDAFLTIYHGVDLGCWMQQLADDTPLSAISIPGTHNTPTCYKALPSVQCQVVSPREQLVNGVRFFDIRVQPHSVTSDKLTLVHSAFSISMYRTKTFRDLLAKTYAFLDENPSETLIMSIKREGIGSMSDLQLTEILMKYHTSGSESRYWYTSSKIPSLGQCRGRIVLLRRFHMTDMEENGDDVGYGIDASTWKDNTSHSLYDSICVQDFYQVLARHNVERKIQYACEQLERAAACIALVPGVTTDKDSPAPPNPLHLNFLSASNFWRSGCWPHKIAASLNPAIVSWLCMRHALGDCSGDGGTGIVICDWVGEGGDWDLVKCIIGFNSKLMKLRRGN